MNKNIFIVWHKYQARVENMQKHFNYKIYYIDLDFKHKYLKIFEYIFKMIQTLLILFKNRPKTVWIQLPPTPLLYSLVVYKLFFKVNVIADCHNGMLRKPWVETPFARLLIKKLSSVIVVHNEVVYERIVKSNIFDKEKIIILEDMYPENDVDKYNISNSSEKSVLFPASFNNDEPIIELINSAQKLPSITFYVTGNIDKFNEKFGELSIPDNFKLTGWLSNEEYKILLAKVNVLLGLTVIGDIQLSVANEGVGFEKAMVLSNTETLRKLFNKGTVFVDNNSEEIAKGIGIALSKQGTLEKEVNVLKEERKEKWNKQATFLDKYLQALNNK